MLSAPSPFAINSKPVKSEIKLEIFLNTCIKKFYELEKVCRYIGNEVFANDMRCIVPLTCVGKNNNKYILSTKSKKNVVFSRYNFQYESIDELREGWIYYACLKSSDDNNQCFIINRIFSSADEVRKADANRRPLSVNRCL